jgi:hypothetical protein
MPWLHIVLGLVLLTLGRTLYWAFVGIAGFVLGVQVAGTVLTTQPEWVRVVAALALGGLGVILAIVVQRLAFALAGLLAGGYLGDAVAQAFGLAENAQLALLIAGAILGAIVAAMVMDWALIVLSSLMGAMLTASNLGLTPAGAIAAFLVLVAAGIAIQSRAMKGRERKPESSIRPQ